MEHWSRCPAARDFPPEKPLALVIEDAAGPLVHAVNSAALVDGARRGMRLTDARALNPALQVMPADLAGETLLLADMARWAQRWSPLVEIDGDDGLRLDVTGAAHLFGGEQGLLEDVRNCFARTGFAALTAIAPTPLAAWALARFTPGAIVSERAAPALADLPVAALRLSPLATRTLERLGLKTIGALAGVERRSLARRFRDGDNPLDALDRALGRKAEPLTATPANRPPRAALRLEEPVIDPVAGPQALDILVPRLVRELEARKLGARQLSLTGFRVDATTHCVSVMTAIASRDPAHLKRLLADKAARLDPGFGFDAFVLVADWSEGLGAAQDSLVEDFSGARDIARLIDRLSVKLGADCVRRPIARQSHVPERASGWQAALAAPQPESRPIRPLRPQRLLDRPEAIAVIYATPEGLPRRFVWRRAVHDIARVAGPERIAPEWWRERSTARLRDYYRVEDQAGRRYWIFRQGLIGDGRGGAPAWFIHGLFV